MRVFFVEIKNNNAYFNESDSYHITCVLRKKINNKVKCCNLKENIFFDAKIISIKPLVGVIDKDSIKESLKFDSNIVCYLGIIKKNNFELAIEKLNEIGIKKVIPVLFERSQNNIILDFDRLAKISYESSKQCNRIEPLVIEKSINFDELINQLQKFDNVFVAHKETDSIRLCDCKILLDKLIAYVIGPEGGFSLKEIKTFKTIRKLQFLKLTDNILRTETAAIYLASVLYERKFNEK